MAILNARSNQFRIKFPKGFVPENIEEKYYPYVNALPQPFRTCNDYLTHMLQNVVFSGFSSETVFQVHKHQHLEKRSGWNLFRADNAELILEFKISEGFITYFLLFEIFREHLKYGEKNIYLIDLRMEMLDWYGNEFQAITFEEVSFTQIGNLECTYGNSLPEYRNVSVTLKYNRIGVAPVTI